MKVTNNNYKVLVLVGLLTVFAACKTKTPSYIPANEQEVIVPCSGADFFSNGETFRSNSIGESKDQVTSKKKALSNARAELAAQIQTTVNAVTDNYVNSREYDNREEVSERFEGLNREIVNQELVGSIVICEKQTRTLAGTYKSYIALELNPDLVLASYNERISDDERLRVDYDYEKFKQTFNEEMKKLAR